MSEEVGNKRICLCLICGAVVPVETWGQEHGIENCVKHLREELLRLETKLNELPKEISDAASKR